MGSKRRGGGQSLKFADKACHRPRARADADVDTGRGKALMFSSTDEAADELGDTAREDKLAGGFAGPLAVRPKLPKRRERVDQEQTIAFREEWTQQGSLPAARNE